MKDENEGDRGTRKSNRQRVPNSFYTDAINDTKTKPRPPREPKHSSKHSKNYQQEDDPSYGQDFEQGRSDPRQQGGRYPCRLPRNGASFRVQFVLNPPEESNPPPRRPEPPKPVKKQQGSTDLLSLFQKAIDTVKEQEDPGVRPAQQQYLVSQSKPRLAPLLKPKRADDPQGKINKVQRTEGQLLLSQSRWGELCCDMEGSSESQSGLELELLDEYREKLLASPTFAQLSIFN